MKLFLFLFLVFLFPSISFSSFYNIPGDTISFKSENEGLIIITQSTDSIEYHIKSGNYPNPFSPTMKDFSAKINTYDTTFLIISINDDNSKEVITFRWEKIIPGAYQFDWWEYLNLNEFPSGVYFVKIITVNGVETKKAILVK